MTEFSKGDYYFFEIPVYRLTEDGHIIERQSEKRRYDQFRKEASPENYDSLIDHLESNVWHDWQYDEIIGWIRLFVIGSQIQAEYWWNIAKKQVKGGRRRFKWRGKAFELNVQNEKQSQGIFDSLLNEFVILQNKRPFIGRYIDLTLLKNIGPYLNWQAMLRN